MGVRFTTGWNPPDVLKIKNKEHRNPSDLSFFSAFACLARRSVISVLQSPTIPLTWLPKMGPYPKRGS